MSTQVNTVQTIPVEQAGLLWCMRMWVAGRQEPGCRTSMRIERMAANLDAPELAHFVEGFMAAINRGASRTVQIGCMGCLSIGADEQLMLDVMGLAQERRFFEALLLFRGLLDAADARAAVLNAEGVGTALARVGRFLPTPGEAPGVFGRAEWLRAETG